MDRREFVKKFGLASAVVAGAVPFFKAGRTFAAKPGSVLSVATGTDWAGLVEKALGPLGGIKAFVKPGMKVAVKPNASFDRKPEQGSNTHPQILTSVVKLCLDAGAKEVTVFDRTLHEERRSYVNSGLAPAVDAINDERAQMVHVDDRKFVKVDMGKGIVLRSWEFYKPALDADAYINVPVAKHHGQAGLSLGLKNILGIIGGNRGKVHWNLDQGIADLNTVKTPTLTIIDATRILLRNGPSGGNLDDVKTTNTVIASADTVAADAYATKHLFKREPEEIEHIGKASNLGIGQMDLDKITIKS